MKRICVAPLCIAVLFVRHAASAQENGSVKSAEVGWTGLDSNQQKSKRCQPAAQSQPMGEVDVQPGSKRDDDLGTAADQESQEHTEATMADSQDRPDLPGTIHPPTREAAAILELGGEPARNLSGAGWSLSPTLAVEVTPIENWLELEFGVTPTFSRHSTEWDTDVLFKKPWVLSKKVEFMLGAGPVWVHARENGITTNSVAGEIALDFMFWPLPTRRLGWYIEPAYDYTFGRSHDQAIGVSIGLLISVH